VTEVYLLRGVEFGGSFRTVMFTESWKLLAVGWISVAGNRKRRREGKPGGKRECLHVRAVSHILYGGWKSDG